MPALPPKADIETQSRDVCFVPKADMQTLRNIAKLPDLLRKGQTENGAAQPGRAASPH